MKYLTNPSQIDPSAMVSLKAGLGAITLGEVLAARIIIEMVGYKRYSKILQALPDDDKRPEALMQIAVDL